MENLTTIVVAIIGSGVLNTLLNYVLSLKEKRKERDSSEQRALRLIMKNDLRTLCHRYIEQGWIYEDELEDLISMHQCYHNDLKGNGYLDEMMRRARNLEIRGIGVK